MKIEFTNDEIEEKINIVELEDVTIIGEYIEVHEDCYILVGTGIVDGESYRDFKVEFTLIDNEHDNNCTSILDSQWDYYDFLFYES